MRIPSLLCLLVTGILTHAQTIDNTTLYFSEVSWSIEVPNKFKTLDSSLQQNIQRRGLQAFSEAYNQPIEVSPYTTLFAIRPTSFNYIDAVISPYNIKEDGDWNESSNSVHQAVTFTFQQKIEGAKIDTITTYEKVGGINFKNFSLTIELPGGKDNLHLLMYTALIDGFDFGLNILYTDKDEGIGKEFLSMWRRSKFNQRFTPPKIKSE